MNEFNVFLRKEITESIRTGRLFILLLLFVLFGIMNPAIAKMLPWMFELLQESMDEIGMSISDITINAFTSWEQFYKNMPMALIAFLLLCSNLFSKEYQAKTLIILVTKGLKRSVIVLSKAFFVNLCWTAGFFLCYGITYFYNDYFWDNSIAANLFPAALLWYFFGLCMINICIFFSVLFNGTGQVLLGTGLVFVLGYLVLMIPKVGKYSFVFLSKSESLLTNLSKVKDFIPAFVVSAVLILLSEIAGVLVINKKQL